MGWWGVVLGGERQVANGGVVMVVVVVVVCVRCGVGCAGGRHVWCDVVWCGVACQRY